MYGAAHNRIHRVCHRGHLASAVGACIRVLGADVATVVDAPLVEVGRQGLHRRGLEAEREGQGQARRCGIEQMQAEHRLVALTQDFPGGFRAIEEQLSSHKGG